jgi:hypothetical protein
MSQRKEERARQKFSDKMRQKSLTARNANLAPKSAGGAKTAPSDVDSGKKD